jgi:flagellar motor switch protein FliM
MATVHPLPAPAKEPPRSPGPLPEAAVEHALQPASVDQDADGLIQPGSAVARLPVEVDVAVPVREFRVRNLLTLTPGQIIETQWAHGDDMPLAAGDVQLAWSEFEVIDAQLAVRVTRLV